MKVESYTAVIHEEEGEYVSLCPELDIASQGKTIEEAVSNLREAVELFFESASEEEILYRKHSSVFITQFEASHA